MSLFFPGDADDYPYNPPEPKLEPRIVKRMIPGKGTVQIVCPVCSFRMEFFSSISEYDKIDYECNFCKAALRFIPKGTHL